MNTQTVSPETAAKLAAAGFPQPAPAPGQWWNVGSEFVFVSESRTKYFTVVRYFPGSRPLVDEYFDLQDFHGLVFLPTVVDILRELGAMYDLSCVKGGLCAVILRYMSNHNPVGSKMHRNPNEAAALAWLDIYEKKSNGMKNAIIREHLAATTKERRSKNCFRFGAVEIKIDHDSPFNGQEFIEIIKVSIYNPDTDVDVVFYSKIQDVQIIENALSE